MKVSLMLFLICTIMLMWVTVYPTLVHAQFLPPLSPFFPYPFFYVNPFPFYPVGYFGFPVVPRIAASPILVEPSLRFANAPVTITLPSVTITTPPLTAIVNLLDPAVLASNIAVLTTNFPLLYDALITTFQLPVI
ncbi:MAG: hypothetical protein ACMUIS_05125 [bacterium]